MGVSTPARLAMPMNRLDSEMMPETEMSMSPSRMTNIIGIAMIAFSMKLNVVSRRFPGSRKYGDRIELATLTRMKMMKSIVSQRRRKSAMRRPALILVRRELSTKPVP